MKIFVNHDELCKKALEIDSKIRFTGVLNNKGILTSGGNKEGTESFLSPEEIGMATHYTLQRWIQCQNLSYKIGNEKSSITEYDKVTMISMPLSGNELFLISTEPGADYLSIVKKTASLLEN